MPRRTDGGKAWKCPLVHPWSGRLFADLDSPTSLRFLTRFGCQDGATGSPRSRLGAWLRNAGCTGCKDPAVLHAHLLAAPHGATGPSGTAAAAVTAALVTALTALVAQIHVLDRHIATLLGAHVNAPIFRSLPRCQTLRAAGHPGRACIGRRRGGAGRAGRLSHPAAAQTSEGERPGGLRQGADDPVDVVLGPHIRRTTVRLRRDTSNGVRPERDPVDLHVAGVGLRRRVDRQSGTAHDRGDAVGTQMTAR